MVFKQVQVGGYDDNFSYIIGDDRSKEVMIIDPIDSGLLLPMIAKEGLKVVMLAPTHGHFDHAGGLVDFYEKLNPKPLLLMHPSLQEKWSIPQAEHKLVEHRQIVKVGGVEIELIPTPGHEPGSICFLVEDKLITGDTLFIDGCGRADLPGGDVGQLYHSLYEVIGKLPDETEIYPGHDYGPSSWATVGQQKKTNRYLKCKNLEEFVALRMN